MSVYIIIYIMLIAGVLGGSINYFMSVIGPDVSQKPNFFKSIIVGIGATALIPLFLEIAKSKLMDGIRNSYDVTVPVHENIVAARKNRDSLKNRERKDTLDKTNKDLLQNARPTNVDKSEPAEELPPLKDYFIFAAYCILASAAGPRFINSLMDGVIKNKEISELKKENHQVTQEKNKIEQFNALQTARDKALADHDEKEAMTAAIVIKPQIGPKTVPNDPQKGRFGGEREVNSRKLCATVDPLNTPFLFKVVIWVESTDTSRPLSGDVIFYLHDTFRPSVITLPESEFTDDGKAKLEPKTAWGAFTVGAVVDGGLTLLEYDLALDKQFDEGFRSR